MDPRSGAKSPGRGFFVLCGYTLAGALASAVVHEVGLGCVLQAHVATAAGDAASRGPGGDV